MPISRRADSFSHLPKFTRDQYSIFNISSPPSVFFLQHQSFSFLLFHYWILPQVRAQDGILSNPHEFIHQLTSIISQGVFAEYSSSLSFLSTTLVLYLCAANKSGGLAERKLINKRWPNLRNGNLELYVIITFILPWASGPWLLCRWNSTGGNHWVSSKLPLVWLIPNWSFRSPWSKGPASLVRDAFRASLLDCSG